MDRPELAKFGISGMVHLLGGIVLMLLPTYWFNFPHLWYFIYPLFITITAIKEFYIDPFYESPIIYGKSHGYDYADFLFYQLGAILAIIVIYLHG